jgi:transcriptional regulator with XRE-family HTH domain
VAGVPRQTWAGVERALRGGWRGLPGGDSLAALLRRARGLRERRGRPRKASRRQVARLLARGLSLTAIARRLGVSCQRVHQMVRYEGVVQIELGTIPDPRVSTLRALARALGVSLDELAGEEDGGDGPTEAPEEPPPPKKPKRPKGRKREG